MTAKKNFELVSKNNGAIHIDGFTTKTNGEWNYASTTCNGLTRIESFVVNFRNSALVAGVDTLAELAELVETKKAKGYKICAKCEQRLNEGLAAEQVATIEITTKRGKTEAIRCGMNELEDELRKIHARRDVAAYTWN